MAVGDHLPIAVSPLPDLSATPLPKSASPLVLRRRLAPVATHNSSAFIRFPITSRKSSAFIPISEQRTNRSLIKTNLFTNDTHPKSDISKTSNPTPSSVVSEQQKSTVSQKPTNPILSNPLLNYRKQEQKPIPNRYMTSFSNTTRLCLSSKSPTKLNPSTTNRAKTVPLIAHHIETMPNGVKVPPDNEYENQEETEYFDQDKYDYITNWLKEIRVSNRRIETLPKIKQLKNRVHS